MSVKLRQKSHWPDLEFLLALLLEVVPELGEGVKQVVDDVRREDAHA